MKNAYLLFLYCSLITFAMGSVELTAQPSDLPEQDCIGAIPVCNGTYDFDDGFIGPGMIMDLPSSQGCLSTGELNSVWFVVNTETAGDLNFLVNPGVTADIDWAVYDITNNGCGGIFGGSSPMVSCNYSLVPGQTGCDPVLGAGMGNSQGAGGTPYNEPIPVNAGETYAVLISNFSSSIDPFNIDFTSSTADILDNDPPELATVTDPVPCGNTDFDISFNEPITCFSGEACDFELIFPDGSTHNITDISSADCDLNADFSAFFTLTADSPMNQLGTYTLNIIGDCAGVEDNCGNVQDNTSITFTTDCTCDISASITTPEYCDDAGTPLDPSDDVFYLEVEVTGIGTGAGWSADDPNMTTGVYDTPVLFGPYDISGGGFTITIADDSDPSCTTTITVTPPATCSGTCSIGHSIANILCDDNGTPSDPSDDTYIFDMEVAGTNTGASWTADEPNNSTGAYGVVVNLGPYPVSGGDLNFTVSDDTDPTCTTAVTVVSPGTCSGTCNIANSVSNILCDDNGTPSDPSDDTHTFEVTVTGSNTGTGWTANDPNNTTGAYGTAVTFGPYDISGGNLSFTITDDSDPTCTTDATVTAPGPCSGENCTITAEISSAPICDDNGTDTDARDDTFTFEVTVSGTFTGSGWTADDGSTGAYGVASTFGPYDISGGNVTLIFSDDADANCSTELTVTPPSPCSDGVDCTISVNLGADRNLDCENPQLILSAEVTDEIGSVQEAQWTGPSPDLVQDELAQTIDVPGTYTVLIVDEGGCTAADTVMIGEEGIPEVAILGAGDISCEIPCLSLVAETDVENPEYQWTGPDITAEKEGLQSVDICLPGEYTVVVTDPLTGCSSTAAVVEIGNETGFEVSIFAAPAGTIAPSESVTLYYTTDIDQSAIDSLYWTSEDILDCPECDSIIVAPRETMTYVLTVIDENGCVETREITVFVESPNGIYVPNAFSPNGDGINDVLAIYGADGIQKVQYLAIFDRWGNRVFELKDFPADGRQGWNGSFKGEPMNPAVYAWRADIELTDGTVENIVGEILLMK